MIDIEGVDGVRTRHKSLWSTGRVTQIEVTPGRHEIELRASFPYDGVETEENPRITCYAESGKTYLLRAEVIKKRVWEEVRRELAGETSYAAVWLIDAATNTVVAGSEPPQPDGATQADQR